jgi:hypothetical protein
VIKHGLLTYNKSHSHIGQINIGDYIQSIAAEQYFDKIDCYLERDYISLYKSSLKTKIIMNGWFMLLPENWPPSDDIIPLFIAFHISPSRANIILSPRGILYLKKYGPIGCRDQETLALLCKYDIPCYFSGCLTLTFNSKVFTLFPKRDKIYFVDVFTPFVSLSGTPPLLRNFSAFYYFIRHIPFFLSNFSKIVKISKKYSLPFRKKKHIKSFRQILNSIIFYDYYRKKFSDELLLNAEYITHETDYFSYKTDVEIFDHARDLLNKYANASLVVTSRIHCALPCLGFETPVIFIDNDNLIPGRLKGLIELFHVMRLTKNGLVSDSDNLPEKITISENTILKNKDDYVPLRESMIEQCREFVSNPEIKENKEYDHITEFLDSVEKNNTIKFIDMDTLSLKYLYKFVLKRTVKRFFKK